MAKTRKRRSLQERIEAHERELEDLREQSRIEEFEVALKENRIPAGKRTEFACQLRELRLVKKAIKAAERHEQTELVDPLKTFQDKIAESMASLVAEGGPSTS